MARKPNKVGTAVITISTTPHVERLLERLVETGLFGKNTAEAAERALTESLRQLLSDATIKELSPKRWKK